MKPKYPNLELLEYKFLHVLRQLDSWKLKMQDINKTNNFKFKLMPEIDCIVFPQVWGSTALGFDIDLKGTTLYGGQSMTKAYTTVFHELNSDYYGVFFGDSLAYVVDQPAEPFLSDLNAQALKSRSYAKLNY